jgi:hypothetical protein
MQIGMKISISGKMEILACAGLPFCGEINAKIIEFSH